MAQPRRALGKGIGALIPSANRLAGGSPALPAATSPSQAREGIQKLPLSSIDRNPRQPRTEFREEDLGQLAESIRESGVLQPILVRPAANGRFELIAGERRFRASERAGLTDIPALIKPMSDDESLLVAIVENVQRADLNPIEEGEGYRLLQDEFGLTQEEVARRVGKSRPAIANALRILQLPESMRAEIRAGRLTAGHARALLAIEDPAEREAVARAVLEEGLSVREAEQEARKRKPSSPARTSRNSSRDPDVAAMEADLSRSLGTKVSIVTSPKGDGRGRVEIGFFSDDDLARLVRILMAAPASSRSRPVS